MTTPELIAVADESRINETSPAVTATAPESEVARFYDEHDAVYRSFWDSDGSLHWGVFDDSRDKDFVSACQDWNVIMRSRADLSPSSKVLDIGCGNGTTALWLAESTGCSVTGIDVSGVRIEAARRAGVASPRLRVEFVQASATDLPFADAQFDVGWSQACLYHVADRRTALREIARVLSNGATFVFDDLTTPPGEVSTIGQRYVYERLMFERGFSRTQYLDELSSAGFVVHEMCDLTTHLRRSYLLLRDRAASVHPALAKAYGHVVEAIDAGDVEWTSYVCERVVDRLEWIYRDDHPRPLSARYDAWAKTYESDLGAGWDHVAGEVAALLRDTRGTTQQRVLDVGCGTGLCGAALSSRGFSDVVGADISSGMLEIAARRGVYTGLHRWDVAADPPPFDGGFAAIVAVGIFTFGHVGGNGLAAVRSLLADAGVAVISYRPEFLEADDVFRRELEHHEWSEVARRELTIFGSERLVMVALRRGN
ncbi:methyltransferase domain-containing protein [Mycobacterium heidelbergense]|uniref:methyltransferase domain-containing protein n=1 Tax=Mycobacterium heidelbergense TaxID=53376 RepID=UPI003CF765A5